MRLASIRWSLKRENYTKGLKILKLFEMHTHTHICLQTLVNFALLKEVNAQWGLTKSRTCLCSAHTGTAAKSQYTNHKDLQLEVQINIHGHSHEFT